MVKQLSVVIPLYNEAESFPRLLSELLLVLESMPEEFEVLFIDDKSTDGTADLIRDAELKHPNVSGVFLKMNTRKCGALREGIIRSTAPIIVTMDGDLQDNPAEIPSLLQAIREGADVVIGWKKDRKDGPGKKIPSRIINYLCSSSLSIKLHDMNSGLKAMTRDAALSAPLFDSLYRYMAHFLAAEGFVVREVPVLHRQRSFGTSKFGWLHRLQGIEDFIFVFLLVGFKGRRFFLWTLILILMTFGLLGLSMAVGTFLGARSLSVFSTLLFGVGGLAMFAFGLRTIIVYSVYRERVRSMDAIDTQKH